MSETLESHSALFPFCGDAKDTACIDATAEVVIRERHDITLVQISRTKPDKEFFDAAARACGGDLPAEPNTARPVPNGWLFWQGPKSWVVSVDATSGPKLEGQLREELAAEAGTVVNLSHGRTVVRIEGRGAWEILSVGCPLDLHPRSFKPGSCAQSVLAHVPILLHLVSDEPIFDLYIPRSYGAWLWQWLDDTAAGS